MDTTSMLCLQKERCIPLRRHFLIPECKMSSNKFVYQWQALLQLNYTMTNTHSYKYLCAQSLFFEDHKDHKPK